MAAMAMALQRRQFLPWLPVAISPQRLHRNAHAAWHQLIKEASALQAVSPKRRQPAAPSNLLRMREGRGWRGMRI